jgi:replication factor A2
MDNNSGGGGGGGGGGGQSFGNAKQDQVYKMVSACVREEGINRDEVSQQLGGKMSKKEVNDALDFLSGEGHIYSTIDDDHFKAIDS